MKISSPLAAVLPLFALSCAGAGPGRGPSPSPAPAEPGEEVVLAYQANVQGEIEPCG